MILSEEVASLNLFVKNASRKLGLRCFAYCDASQQGGKRHTQEPQSRLRRIVGDIEVLRAEERELHVTCSTMIFESALRGDIIWASRNEFVLRREGRDFKIVRKKVALVNNDKALFTLSFLV